MWTIVQQAFHRNIQMDHSFQQTYPMIPSLQQFLDHRDPTISLPQTNAGTPFDVFVSPRCKPMQRLPHALNLTTGNVWNPWKRYCIRSELSFGAFCRHGRCYKHWNILKHPETVQQIGQSFNLPHLLHHLFGAQNAAAENSAWCKQWRAKNVLSCHDQSRLGYHPVGDMSLVMSAECAKENLSTQLYEGRWLEEKVKKMRTDSNSILLIWVRCVSHV